MGDTGQIGDRFVTYAGFWIRVAGATIDGFVLWPANIGFHFLVFEEPFSPDQPRLLAALVTTWGFGAIVGWLYAALMESSKRQATLGKMLVGVKVTDLEGNRISFGIATGRQLTEYLCGVALGLGYLVSLFTVRRQCLHDKISRTLVLETRGSLTSRRRNPPPTS